VVKEVEVQVVVVVVLIAGEAGVQTDTWEE